jgi:hypothetical protein
VPHVRFKTSDAIGLIAAGCLVMLLGACAQTTALEPQNQSLDARHARIYFIRNPVFVGKLGSADIKIDGKLVGAVAAGTYIVADRPPGPHKISVYGAIDSVGTESEINIQPGISYYFELGPSVVRTNMDRAMSNAMGVTGQPVPARIGPNSPYQFFSLDATAGAASIARLRSRS